MSGRVGFDVAKFSIEDERKAINQSIDPSGDGIDPFDEHRRPRIVDRDNEYTARRFNRQLSPSRSTSQSANGSSSQSEALRYKETMMDARLAQEEAAVIRKIQIQQSSSEAVNQATSQSNSQSISSSDPTIHPSRKRSRWQTEQEYQSSPPVDQFNNRPTSIADDDDQEPLDWDDVRKRRDDSDDESSNQTTNQLDATPKYNPQKTRSNRWDATPAHSSFNQSIAPPVKPASLNWDAPSKTDSFDQSLSKRNRWDQTPAHPSSFALGKTAPSIIQPANQPMSADQLAAYRLQQEIDDRNRPWTDQMLDSLLPGEADGYTILQPPESYKPVRSRKILSQSITQSTADLQNDGFFIASEALSSSLKDSIPALPEETGLPALLKSEDQAFFGCLLDRSIDESTLDPVETNRRRVLRLLLKIKNGQPPQRKSALRIITDKAREFGAGPLFDAILPLLMSPSLDDSERHVLVKVVDRVLYKLDEQVRPYVSKILVVIEPLLIDEDYFARVEGREIISNLAKAAGLATMIATMRPDIDNVDEYVRNTTARAFAVVASALGIHSLLPFIAAVCRSKAQWHTRHTGMKIIQQIAILMGMAVLPHLSAMIECVGHGLNDEQPKVKCIAALSLAALAEASYPYGLESFDSVLRPLWLGVKQQRGKTLAAFLKAIGFIIPLMDAEYASYYTREVMPILMREFGSVDEEMKKIVIKVLKQCCSTEGIDKPYIVGTILPEFFRHFWVRRMALDRRNHKELVECTVTLSERVGCAPIIERLSADLKDESEVYRRMCLECIEKVLSNETSGASELTSRQEEQLIDGCLYLFQEQQSEDLIHSKNVVESVGLILQSLAQRCKPYLPQLAGMLKWRLNHASPLVRGQSADLIGKIAVVMKQCGEVSLLQHLSSVCYELLGEEYPHVLGSLLSALHACFTALGVADMQPSVKDLLPRLTPILKNRHEQVSEQCILLVGALAREAASEIHSKEWMRICSELLEMLKAPRLRVRRATVSTFGSISQAIGPHDVLATLLNQLRVVDRQMRVCSCVAIAIVAEQCSPFTVLPALLNEYSVPEMNVQNGVLKALAFVFEYLNEAGAEYVYAVVPVLEDALIDRDPVHRQIACTVVKHIALACVGMGREDAILHLFNLVWPNLFETSPHLINAVFEACEACRLALGPHYMMMYLAQGLFHPARHVRQVYWRLYNQTLIASQDACVACVPLIDKVDSKVVDELPEHDRQLVEQNLEYEIVLNQTRDKLWMFI